MDTMKYNPEQVTEKDETYDYSNDLTLLSNIEKRSLLKTAKNLLKVQNENNVFFLML